MKLLILASVVAMAVGGRLGYRPPAPSQPSIPSAGGTPGTASGGGPASFSDALQQYSAPGRGGGFTSESEGGDLRSNGGFQFGSGALNGDFQGPSGAGALDGDFQGPSGAGALDGDYQGPSGAGAARQDACAEGEVLQVDGSCAQPVVNRRIFVYAAPPTPEVETLAPRALPPPKVDYNLVFVRTKQQVGGAKPLVVPPPQQKTLVYVLNEKSGALEQEVIEVPSTPTEPEVYFVNYDQGDNPTLPGGIALSEALARFAQQGEVIDGAPAGGDGAQIRGDEEQAFGGGDQAAGSLFGDGQAGGFGAAFGAQGGLGENRFNGNGGLGANGFSGNGGLGGNGGLSTSGFNGNGGLGGSGFNGNGAFGSNGGAVRTDYAAPVQPAPQPPQTRYSQPQF